MRGLIYDTFRLLYPNSEIYSSRYFFYGEGDSIVLFRTQYFNSHVKKFIIKFINKHNNIGIIKTTNFKESINNQNHIHW